MPSERMVQAARDGFPHSNPSTEKESVELELTRANVLVQNIKDKMPYDEDDAEWHDIRAILGALERAHEYVRRS